MTDLEISKALALAIGWKPTDLMQYEYKTILEVWWVDGWDADWRAFDYRDWNVIGPIAERYDCFPIKAKAPTDDEWLTAVGKVIYTDTPQKAIALAVIGASK